MIRAANYSAAAYPEPFTILGLRLKPLSLQHYLLMHRFDVAFVAEGNATADFSDLVMGVLICSKHWRDGEFEDFIESDKWEEEIQQWGERVGLLTKEEKLERLRLFEKYITDNSAIPEHWKLEQGRASAAHLTQCLLNTSTVSLGYSRKEAIHAPLRQVLSDYFYHAESQGLVQLATNEEIELIEAAESGKEEALANA